MKFKKLLVFLFILLLIDGIIAKYGGKSFTRSSGTSRGYSRSYSRGYSQGASHGGSSRRTSNGRSSTKESYGKSYGKSSSPAKPVATNSLGQKPTGSTTPKRILDLHPTNRKPERKEDINTQLLKAEGGHVTHPDQVKRAPPPHSTNTHFIATTPIPRTGGSPRVETESKQSTPIAGTFQNQSTGHSAKGQAYPSWSNPFLATYRPSTSAQSYPIWNNPSSAINRTTHHPHIGNNKLSATYPQSTTPISYSTPIGFKPQVYPQTHPISAGTQFSPTISGHPPYPSHPMSSNSPWSTPPVAPPLHQTNPVSLDNSYTMHPPSTFAVPGHPQRPIYIPQPAGQPIVPGQTVILAQGQTGSSRSTGEMIKEALIFSTISAGVNKILNPHSYTHYQESRPEAIPITSTHITYNNQYFNIPPGVNVTRNITNVPQEPGSNNNNQNGAFTPTGPQVVGSINNYTSEEYNLNMGGGYPSPPVSGDPYAQNILTTKVPSTTSINNSARISSNVVNSTGASTIYSDQANSPNNHFSANTMPYRISEDELLKISEELFAHTPQDLHQHIKLNLQTRVISLNITDEAKESLFHVDPDILEYPTIYVTRSLYDKYEHDFRKKLNRTTETRKQENLLIDTFLNTDVMEIAMQWLADRGFIDPDDFERKDILRRIWFTMFSGSSCGFERVFASESYGNAIIGVHDWIYFENQESLKRIDYMGYVDKLDIGRSASLLKLNFAFDGIVIPNATIFLGTRPELEMSLYTICFYARPNNVCPISLAGTKFYIYTHSFTYFGNEIIDFGLPAF